MWSGFSSEIETSCCQRGGMTVYRVACGAASHLRLKQRNESPGNTGLLVACGAASHLRLKLPVWVWGIVIVAGRMWSGFSSEIETEYPRHDCTNEHAVACGAASHLRLKLNVKQPDRDGSD